MLSHSRLFVAIAFAATLLVSAATQAQKPVLTKNIDEPGRSPYFSETYNACAGNGCNIDFTPVPAGFRLVVTHAAVIFNASSTSGYRYATLSHGIILDILYLPAPALIGDNYYLISTPVTYYVEPGITPQMSVRGNSTSSAVATIVGYLVAIP